MARNLICLSGVLAGLLGVGMAGCSPRSPAPSAAPSRVSSVTGTQGMASLLEQARAQANPARNEYLSNRRAALGRELLNRDLPLEQRMPVTYQLAQDLLNANENGEALRMFERFEADLREHDPAFLKENGDFVQLQKAVAWLRIGEQANCVGHHTTDSCLFPIAPGGVHQEPEGSRKALEILLDLLRRDAGNTDARWLLNVAAMTLGEYPAAVPVAFRLPENAFDSQQDPGRFPDVAGAAGVNVVGLSGGGALEDFDGDGWLDLFVSSWSLEDPVRGLFNRRDGTFEDRTRDLGLEGITGGLNLVTADYDNDGDTDIFLLRGAWQGEEGRHPNSLLRNRGDGTFEDATQAAGLLSFHPTQTAVWWDYDVDGFLDLFVGNESTPRHPHPCELFRNNGDGTFSETSAGCGLNVTAFVKGAASGDYNNDGLPDLFLSVMDGPNRLLRNGGPAGSAGWRFVDATASAGVTEPVFSFPCWFWDYDNDGWEDLFVAGYRTEGVGRVLDHYLGRPPNDSIPRLYRNNRAGGFEDVTSRMGLRRFALPMGVNFGDIDNDGWLDFYLGTGDPDLASLMPNLMFRNHRAEGFQDVTTAGGFGHLQKGHAVSFGDVDHDGDQDVHAVMGGAVTGDRYMNALFQNPGHGHGWVKLKLVGTEANRCAIGARLHLTLKTPGKKRDIWRTVGTGGSFGCNPLRQEVGLGQATGILQVSVIWPGTRTPESFTGVEPGGFFRLTQGAGRAEIEVPRSAAGPTP